MEKSRVALVHRDSLPGATGLDKDVLDYPRESVTAIQEMIEEALALSIGGVKEVIRPGQRVFLKPNCFANVPPTSYASLDPRVMEALCRTIKQAVPTCHLMMGDSPSLGKILGGSRQALEHTGLAAAAQRGGVDEVLYLDEMELLEVAVPAGKAIKRARVFKVLVEADVLINVPKMKTHIEGYVTMSLKNWNGIIVWDGSMPFGNHPTAMEGSHRSDLGQKMVDLHKALPAHFTLLDGIIGMEGQGPHAGTRVDMNCIIASRDPVAVDAVSCAVMGIDPFEVPAIRIAHHEGVGTARVADEIEVVGTSIEAVRRYFKRPVGDPAGAVAGVDVYEAGTCPGCMAMIRGGLDGFVASGQTVDKVGILAGWNVPAPSQDYDLFLTVGDCWKTSPTRAEIDAYLDQLQAEGARVFDYPGCSPVYVFVEINNTLQAFATGDLGERG
jgi:uncharacterized protein (DUF362 family)